MLRKFTIIILITIIYFFFIELFLSFYYIQKNTNNLSTTYYYLNEIKKRLEKSKSQELEKPVLSAEKNLYSSPLELTQEDINIFSNLKIGISNMNDPTNVHSNKETLLTFYNRSNKLNILKKNVQIKNYMIQSNARGSYEHPTIFRLAETDDEYLNNYIKTKNYFTYEYETNELNQRIVIPYIENKKKIIIVGDSVGFGVGVNNGSDVVSLLQKKTNDFQFINLSVGGYNTQEIQKVISDNKYINTNAIIIYIACQNDFITLDEANIFDQKKLLSAKKLIETKIKQGLYKDGLIVLTPDIYFLLSNFIQEYSNEQIITLKNSYDFFDNLDFKNKINFYKHLKILDLENKSFTNSFSYYVDQIHFSPRGNQVLADTIYEYLLSTEIIKN